VASEIRALPRQLITEAHQCRARPFPPMPARHTAHGQPWAGVWRDRALSSGVQNALRNRAWLCYARRCRHTASVRGCGSLLGAAGHYLAWHGMAMLSRAGVAWNGRHTAHPRVRCSLHGTARRGKARLGMAGQGRHTAASDGRCSLRGSARYGTAQPAKAGRGTAGRGKNIRLITGKLYE